MFSLYLMLSWILFSKLQRVNWISSSEYTKDGFSLLFSSSCPPPSFPDFLWCLLCFTFDIFGLFLKRRWATWYLRTLCFTLKKSQFQSLSLLWASPLPVLLLTGQLWAKLLWPLMLARSQVYEINCWPPAAYYLWTGSLCLVPKY